MRVPLHIFFKKNTKVFITGTSSITDIPRCRVIFELISLFLGRKRTAFVFEAFIVREIILLEVFNILGTLWDVESTNGRVPHNNITGLFG